VDIGAARALNVSPEDGSDKALREEIAAKIKDRFPSAEVTVEEAGGRYQTFVKQPGHRTLGVRFAPEQVEFAIHNLWIGRRQHRASG
jgi:hypothetical protein